MTKTKTYKIELTKAQITKLSQIVAEEQKNLIRYERRFPDVNRNKELTETIDLLKILSDSYYNDLGNDLGEFITKKFNL